MRIEFPFVMLKCTGTTFTYLAPFPYPLALKVRQQRLPASHTRCDKDDVFHIQLFKYVHCVHCEGIVGDFSGIRTHIAAPLTLSKASPVDCHTSDVMALAQGKHEMLPHS